MAYGPRLVRLGVASCCDQPGVLQEGNLHRNQRNFGIRRVFAVTALALLALTACNSNSTTTTTSSAIKIGILSDCLGDFGSFYNDDLGGALAVLAAHYGG